MKLRLEQSGFSKLLIIAGVVIVLLIGIFIFHALEHPSQQAYLDSLPYPSYMTKLTGQNAIVCHSGCDVSETLSVGKASAATASNDMKSVLIGKGYTQESSDGDTSSSISSYANSKAKACTLITVSYNQSTNYLRLDCGDENIVQ